MPWPKPPPAGVFCATPYHMAMRDVSAQVHASMLSASMPSASMPSASMPPNGWPAPPGVHALTTLRGPVGDSAPPFDQFNLGLRCGDDAEVVAGNRVMLEKGLELPSPPRWLRQVHGTGVVRFDDPLPGPAGDAMEREALQELQELQELEEPEADAAITQVPGTVLAILTADCLPVVFAARDGSEVAVAHAGWRGLAAGVLEATVAAMRTQPADIVAWLGPAAGADAYEVGDEVRDAFVQCDAGADVAFAATRPRHWHVDLYALARQRLAGVGVADVHGGGLCTISDPQRFFSHRRDGRSGRMATLAYMQPLQDEP